MEVAVELEDDLFFADLSKQISLLIMDEDEDPLACCPADSLQSFSGAIHPPPQPAIFYEQASQIQSKGTGVYPPVNTAKKEAQERKIYFICKISEAISRYKMDFSSSYKKFFQTEKQLRHI